MQFLNEFYKGINAVPMAISWSFGFCLSAEVEELLIVSYHATQCLVMLVIKTKLGCLISLIAFVEGQHG